jgi:hypothetical protein
VLRQRDATFTFHETPLSHSVLNGLAETDAETQTYDAAFRKRLDELGWIDGHNIHIDYRWGAGSVERMRLFAKAVY